MYMYLYICMYVYVCVCICRYVWVCMCLAWLSVYVSVCTALGVIINTMMTTFLFEFIFPTSFFKTSKKINQVKLLIGSFCLLPCWCVSPVWKLGRNKRFKSKITFIVLINTTTTTAPKNRQNLLGPHFCGNSHDPGQGLGWKFQNIASNLIFFKCWKSTKENIKTSLIVIVS